MPQARLDALLESEINAGNSRQGHRRLCDFLRGNCHSEAHVCHYSTPREMEEITRIIRKQNPEEYRVVDDGCAGCDEGHRSHGKLSPIVDIFSFASSTDHLLTQKQVMGSSKLVRRFYNFSSANDNDPSCLASQFDVEDVAKRCKEKGAGETGNWLLSGLRSPYSRSKHFSPSWVCEQGRLIRGISAVLGEYKTGATVLPDYLIIMNDKTYFNVGIFAEMLRNVEIDVNTSMKETAMDSIPLVVGGCVREYKVFNSGHFRVPLLASGIILNREMLKSLLEPMNCSSTSQRDPRCKIMEESQIWEKDIFRDGMSPIDILSSYASTDARLDFIKGVVGTCVEAEW